MQVNDFAAILSLFFGVSLTLVAAESARSFASNLCERIYKISEYISTQIKECTERSPDKESLAKLKATNVNGKSTQPQIENVRRAQETLDQEIKECATQWERKAQVICQLRSLPSVCVYLSLHFLFLLFLGVIDLHKASYTPRFVFVSCLLSLVYLVLAGLFGESKGKHCSLFRFAEWWHPVIYFGLVLALCSALPNNHWAQDSWWWVLFGYLGLLPAGFVSYALVIWSSVKNFKQEVKEKSQKLGERGEKLKEEAGHLAYAGELSK